MISKSKLLNAFSMERLVGKYTTPMNPTRWAPTPISKLMIPVAAIYRRYSIYSHNYVTNPICNWIRCASCLGPFFFETKNYCPFFFSGSPSEVCSGGLHRHEWHQHRCGDLDDLWDQWCSLTLKRSMGVQGGPGNSPKRP